MIGEKASSLMRDFVTVVVSRRKISGRFRGL